MNLFKVARMLSSALLAVSLVATPAQADGEKTTNSRSIPDKKPSGKILFTRSGDAINNDQLWSASLNGTEEKQVLSQIFKDSSGNTLLALSPDGKRVIYSHKPGNLDVYTGEDLFDVRLDGTGKRRLTNTNFMFYSRTPRFSPDGKRIVYARFTGYRMGGPGYTDAEIRVMNADGSHDRRLAGSIKDDLEHNDYNPFWSKDGKDILFFRTNGNMDYQYEFPDKFKLELRVISTNGRYERKFYDEWDRFPKFIQDEEKARLGARIGDEVRVNNVLPYGKQIVFQSSQTVIKPNADGLDYSETLNKIWKSDSDGENAREIVSDGQLIGVLP